MSGEILPGATEAVGGVLEGFGHGGSYVAPVVGAGTDVHVVVDAALAEGTDEDGLAAWAREEYDIEDEQALRADIREFLDSMLAKHLLVRCGV